MRKKQLGQVFLGLLGLVVFNILAQQYFFRIDLTEEQRYSLHPATKQILKNLEVDIVIKVYLEGEFPPDFQRLQKAVRETLDEFKAYAGRRLSYRFIDPSVAKNEKERNQRYRELYEKGILPTNVFAKEEGQRVEKIIFPGALLTAYDPRAEKTFETSTLLFKVIDQKVQGAPSPAQILNQSVENVEFNLISAIRQLTQSKKQRIGLVEGHGELENVEMATIIERLREFYEVVKIPLPMEPRVKEGVDALIIAKPDSAFPEEDKLKIDQYIMQGGRVLFFADVVGVYMDSVLREKGSFTFPVEHNLLDMFFKYGVRLNPTLIKDLNAGLIPIVVGNIADGRPNIQPLPWTYYPLLNNFGKHPITKNLGPIQAKYISTMDTVKAPGIRKTPLVFSSQYARVIPTPTEVLYEEERRPPNPRLFNQGPLPVAYLLEGAFSSIYKSRPFSKRPGFVANGKPTKVLICADGDLIRNDTARNGEPVPLGFDMIRQTTYSNADFLLQALDYMLDEQGVIGAKNKEIVLRPLDKIKLNEARTFWQVFNLGMPILSIALLGFVFFFWRKRTYQR
ncbi:MAG: gliding motility-associated ABC transporter substrate-binding protein GldG [Microscillaceae bacterium]|nr:gliding motility-associated ABC transporter substrate-binding protein GldG [Microscillaceae bacterium]